MFVLGVFGAVVDKFPLGAVINKGLTTSGAQQHGQRYRDAAGEDGGRDLVTEHLATHVMPLEEGPRGYAMSKDEDRRLRPGRLPSLTRLAVPGCRQSCSASTRRATALSRPGRQTTLWVPSQKGISPLCPHRQRATVRRRRGSGVPSGCRSSMSPRTSIGPSG